METLSPKCHKAWLQSDYQVLVTCDILLVNIDEYIHKIPQYKGVQFNLLYQIVTNFDQNYYMFCPPARVNEVEGALEHVELQG